LLDSWTTPTQNLTVAANGTIHFNGYYGDYQLTVGGKTVPLSLLKGTTAYSIPFGPGDFNGDGVVNAADYIVWRDTVGSTTDLRADANGDQLINDADFNIWRSSFGNSYSFGSGAMAGSSVPEPAAFSLFMMACVAISTGRLRLTERLP